MNTNRQYIEHVRTLQANESSNNSRHLAFEALVKDFQDFAWAYALGRLGDAHRAEDAAQEAFLLAWSNIRQLKEPLAFPKWFKQILHNRCHKYREDNNVNMAYVAADPAATSKLNDSPTKFLIEEEEARIVEQAVAGLPEGEKVAATLYFISDYTTEEIADLLEISAGAVKARIHAAREKLQSQLIGVFRESLIALRPSRNEGFMKRITEILHAAAVGDSTQVRMLLEEDAELARLTGPHPYWGGHPTALHVAAEWGNDDVAKELLEKGADPNYASPEYGGWTPLHRAIHRGHLRGHIRTAHLLAKYADIIDAIAAAGLGDLYRLKQLEAADRGSLKKIGPDGSTALHWAASAECAAFLLTHGLNRDAQDEEGNTPIRWAVWHGHDDVIDVLLKHGAQSDIFIAAARGNVNEVQSYLAKNPSLISASTFKNDRVARFSGGTPLHIAAIHGRAEVARFLIGKGADVNARSFNGNTPLHEVSWSGSIETAQALIDAGADVHTLDPDHNATPAMWAKFQRKTELAAFLECRQNPA